MRGLVITGALLVAGVVGTEYYTGGVSSLYRQAADAFKPEPKILEGQADAAIKYVKDSSQITADGRPSPGDPSIKCGETTLARRELDPNRGVIAEAIPTVGCKIMRNGHALLIPSITG